MPVFFCHLKQNEYMSAKQRKDVEALNEALKDLQRKRGAQLDALSTLAYEVGTTDAPYKYPT